MNDTAQQLMRVTLIGLAGYVGYMIYVQSTADESGSETASDADAPTATITDSLQTLWENFMNSTTGNWASQGEGPIYADVFSEVEQANGIPTNLLFRIGYQESHFRPDIISGATRSSAGAIGIMQLLPQYFPSAGADPATDINTAGEYLAQLYQQFGDWQVVVGAYNDGPGNMKAILAGTKTMPLETQNYIADVIGDVPVQGSLINV